MAEQRCSHGFLRSVTPCSVCDRGPKAQRQTLAHTISNEQIADAVLRAGSVYAAAAELGITKSTVHNRAKQSELVRAALQSRRPTSAEAHGLVGFYTCSTCGETKPKSDFYINRTEPRGHQSRCKTCDNNKARTQALRARKRLSTGETTGEA
jgi:hypothetical protein